jgi:hypothetical protein
MSEPLPTDLEEIAIIIARAAKLPLPDAAFSLWCERSRLDRLEHRYPTDEEARINRSLRPEQCRAKYEHERSHAYEGPMFGYVRRAQPHAGDAEIKQAIITAVKFEDECFRHFEWTGDFWDAVVRAVAQAARKYPDYLDTTYRDARNNVAYYMK